ncbi:Insulin-degrading enzyme, putative [Ichthyophthirius multifiliis]|uniref:Insulin-degrading enzyme, putative n=1 Tax=Ichthyophthirius multifiliis TaxID=5932 RepID=G0QRY9_ICHMU|nr:Insulin-degrading enzyme, putative [Ichthyophthirius multifiliis]EGR32019.1 Insulin-degrading enzyme, putative [Ichthyophthirius multifiliis]|eukprot:XP_004035505.1 Insulin-degrading enzyme, putative [Ichthyophthirius multifiliis]
MFRRTQYNIYQNINKILDENSTLNHGALWLGDYTAALDNYFKLNKNHLKKKYQSKTDIIKPKNDKFNYEYYNLENGIKVLIAVANKTEQIGASLTIKGVGSYQDPKDIIYYFYNILQLLMILSQKVYIKMDKQME